VVPSLAQLKGNFRFPSFFNLQISTTIGQVFLQMPEKVVQTEGIMAKDGSVDDVLTILVEFS